MTLEGWVDYSDREAVEGCFRSQICGLLSAQGVDDSEKVVFSVELSNAVGLLQYYVQRMKNGSNGLWEGYL